MREVFKTVTTKFSNFCDVMLWHIVLFYPKSADSMFHQYISNFCENKRLYMRYVHTVFGFVLVLQHERSPKDASSSQHVLTCLNLFAAGTLALASLSLM